MIVSYKIIRQRIKAIWPRCRNIWPNDPEYEYPTLDEIKAVVADDQTDRLAAHGYRFDCDDFALQLCAAVSKYRGESAKGDGPGPWPFGQAKVRKHRGKKETHNLNICVLENEIILIEPQDDNIWTASAIDDDPFFIGMPF